jgi:uridylate kinase
MKVVISLGGSLIVPHESKVEYLRGFKELVMDFVNKGYKFVIFCGGGSVAREYQKAAKELGVEDENLDWIGISATKLNADLVRSVFNLESFHSDPNEVELNGVVVMSGWKPGWSTDNDAVIVAKRLKADMIINITDVEHVYDKDPHKLPGAKPLEKLSWEDMKRLVGENWKPGMNVPFDPVAIENAKGLKVIVTGKNLENLRNIISGKEFVGTTIS